MQIPLKQYGCELYVSRHPESREASKCPPYQFLQISKHWYEWQLDTSLDIDAIHTILLKYAYPCETRYADFIGCMGNPILNISVLIWWCSYTSEVDK